ncbi:CPBP family intramembrane glutamic endopeptidase [Microbacterium sp. UFMG61]|uniref:CPBP family intramembrane glutamic endopeptidase n=1 Tax=Microbacterium sp. UFMG61 TaxID=2745935 RepID=UPI00188FF9E0|nr:type II CAAX endopeptidase family protein [Microbacterium sp. UFMG61]
MTSGRPRSIWLALAAVVVYVLLAAGLGSLLSGLVSDEQELAQFSLGHFIPLAIAIIGLLLFLRWAGWGEDVWRERPTPTLTPRRWWLVSIPVLVVLLPISQFGDVPWASRPIGYVLVIAAGTLMVGFGEELLIRGVLLTAVRARHGELIALLGTSLVFALAHIPGSIIAGASLATIAFQVSFLAAAGAAYYWGRRVTGRLWVAMLAHAFTDWVLYLASRAGTPGASMPHDHAGSPNPIQATVQIMLLVATTVSIISVIREDRRRGQAAAERRA